MKTRTLLLGACASIALATSAQAQEGWYFGAELGANWISDVDAALTVVAPTTAFAGTGTISTDTGWALVGTWGYDFGNHWRVEGEVGYRDNTTTTDIFEITEWSLMVNALYDIEITPSTKLSLGAGIGYDVATLNLADLVDDDDGNFAYQGIAGLSFGISPNMDLTLTYRYLGVSSPSFSIAGGGASATADLDDVSKHALTVGLRFKMFEDGGS